MPTKQKNLLGMKQGRLTVLRQAEKIDGKYMWECGCYCGNIIIYPTSYLLHTKFPRRSCGRCYDQKKYPVEYMIWEGIHDRCYNKNRVSWINYGGRGIEVCLRWRLDFLFFLEDMGFRPNSNVSLDRIDNNRNYSKENCRWTNTLIQNNNKSQGNQFFSERNDYHV